MSHNAKRSSSVTQFGIVAGAGALILYGLLRRNKQGIVLATVGGLIAYERATLRAQKSNRVAEAVFRVNATSSAAYRLWRQFDNLPRFMAHLYSVRSLGDGRSEWIASGPLGSRVRWEAEITEDYPDARIAWRSLPGGQIQTKGWVEFQDDPQGRGSIVRAHVEYSNPLGTLGNGLLTLLGKNPSFVVKEDLRRFKSLLEAGEAPTIAGQTHGPRGIHGRTEEVLFRETSNVPSPQASNASLDSAAA